ncbi:MAG: protein kinase [Candidatus Eremiobacteraeota bacterium]|nr:protein kinase [Candidatus Eremiobacteraeota bacterium]
MTFHCEFCGKQTEQNICSDCREKMAPGGPVGPVIDNRYEILAEIKSGGRVALYKARSLRDRSIVTVKRIYPSGADPADLKLIKERFAEEERFKDLGKTLSTLNQRGLPLVFDFFSAPDPSSGQEAYFIVMTYHDGTTLETMMRERKTFPLQEVLDFIRQLLETLKYLHTRGSVQVHGDINPANIMIREGEVTLLGQTLPGFSSPRGKSLLGGGFLSPEGEAAWKEPRGDLYSIGLLMFCLLKGEKPESLSKASLESLRSGAGEIPGYLGKVIASMVSWESGPPPSAGKVLEILRMSTEVLPWADFIAVPPPYPAAAPVKYPGDKVPSYPDNKVPVHPEDRKPSHPDDRRPVHPDDRKPVVHPDDRKPAHPDEKGSVKPEERTPAAFERRKARSSMQAEKPPHPSEAPAPVKIIVNEAHVTEFRRWLEKNKVTEPPGKSDSPSPGAPGEGGEDSKKELELLSSLPQEAQEEKIELINSLIKVMDTIKVKEEPKEK